jgi:hypothetical protein
MYGVKVIPFYNGQRYYWAVNRRDIDLCGARKVTIATQKDVLFRIIQRHFNIPRADILLLEGGVVENGMVEKQELTTKIDNLIKGIHEVAPSKALAVKLHPRFSELYSRERSLPLIDSMIPANLLTTQIRCVIGYNSSLLYEAAEKGILAISLLDYFVPVSQEEKKQWKKYLGSNCSKGCIYYPALLQDIIDLVQTL